MRTGETFFFLQLKWTTPLPNIAFTAFSFPYCVVTHFLFLYLRFRQLNPINMNLQCIPSTIAPDYISFARKFYSEATETMIVLTTTDLIFSISWATQRQTYRKSIEFNATKIHCTTQRKKPLNTISSARISSISEIFSIIIMHIASRTE